MLKDITGKVFGDKGYICKPLFQELWHKGIQLITGIRKNMKNYLLPNNDKGLLRKRFIIETVFDKLKTSMGLEHSRHRAPANAFVHILSCIAAYMLGKNKVKMGPVTVTKTNQADRRSSIALIQNSGILEYSPAYSPDYNPIEHTWAQAKAYRQKQEKPLNRYSPIKSGIKVESSGYICLSQCTKQPQQGL